MTKSVFCHCCLHFIAHKAVLTLHDVTAHGCLHPQQRWYWSLLVWVCSYHPCRAASTYTALPSVLTVDFLHVSSICSCYQPLALDYYLFAPLNS